MSKKVTKIEILGAGGGGTSAAAHLTTLGFEVRLYSQDESALAPLKEIGGIEYDAPFGKGLAKISISTSDAALAMDQAELVMVVSPAHLHTRLTTPLFSRSGSSSQPPSRVMAGKHLLLYSEPPNIIGLA